MFKELKKNIEREQKEIRKTIYEQDKNINKELEIIRDKEAENYSN